MNRYNETKEIDEAINAANDALYHLTNAYEYLKKSKNWGLADIFGGGGIVSLIKNGKVREAQREMTIAKESLEVLSNELRDVDMYLDDDLDPTGLLGIADTVFDNFGLDILAQTRINRSLKDVERLINTVEGVLDALSDIRTGMV